MDLRRASEMIGRKRMWKLESAITGMVAGMAAQKLIKLVYRSFRKDKTRATPFDSSSARFSWANAVLWAAAAGVSLGVAKVMSNRVAALGWELATGTLPPGTEAAINHT